MFILIGKQQKHFKDLEVYRFNLVKLSKSIDLFTPFQIPPKALQRTKNKKFLIRGQLGNRKDVR